MKKRALMYQKQTKNQTNTERERFNCEKCLKSYKNKRHLIRHQKEECIGVEPRFKCDICLAMFRRKYHLTRHIQNRHN